MESKKSLFKLKYKLLTLLLKKALNFKIIFLLALFICHSVLINGQNYVTFQTVKQDLKEKYKEALKITQSGDFAQASKKYAKILKDEPRFIDARIQLAACLEEAKSFQAAIDEYKNVLKIDTFYEVRVLFRLGMLEKQLELYEDAAYHYSRFISLYKGGAEIINKAKIDESSCRMIMASRSSKYEFKPENLGPGINGKTHEYLPCLTADGETMIFTRITSRQEDFWVSHLVNGTWTLAKPLTDINTNENDGAESISADGKTLVFTGCDYKDSKGSCDLYISYFKYGSWTKPVNMDSPVNSTAWDSQPSLSANGDILYFSSGRPGGKGRRNIWVSKKDNYGKWTTPTILPTPINNDFDAESPFIHPDGKTLYFRSNGLPSFGGYDLYLTRLNEDNSWSTPLNLGKGINTKGDEGTLIVDFNGVYAYYASDGKQIEGIENFGGNDIYKFKIPDNIKPFPVTYVKAKVTDQNTGKSLISKIQIEDLTSQKSYIQSETDENGDFLVCLPVGKSYALNVSKEKYTFYSAHFSLDSVKSKKDPYLLEIKLQKLDDKVKAGKSTPVILRNIFFDSGSFVLKSESDFELKRLLDLLTANPGLKIRINGHTDNIGSESDNLNLSENRAKAVYTYLINEGIPANRLSYKGFGETKPMSSNETEEGRQSNRRTEFEIVP